MKFKILSIMLIINFLSFAAVIEQEQKRKQEQLYIEDKAIDYNNILLFASKTNNLDLLKNAILNGANINLKDSNLKATPLIHAIMNEQFENAAYLIESKALIDAKDGSSAAALHHAVMKSNIKLVELLLKSGANKDITTDLGKNALHVCSLAKKNKRIIKTAQLLIDFNVDKDAYDKEGLTPLLFAISQSGPISLINILLENRAEANKPDARGVMPLIRAVKDKNIEAVKSLILWGANLEARDPNSRETALHDAIWHESDLSLEITKILLNSKADTEAPIGDTTILGYLARSSRPHRIPLLLSYGAQLARPLTIEQEITKVNELLQFAPADQLNKSLIFATLLDNSKHVETLLKKSITSDEINKRDRVGSTALMWATARENIAIVKTLLNYGSKNNHIVNAHAINEFGESAAYVACARKNNEIVCMLFDYLEPQREILNKYILDAINLDESTSDLVSQYIYGGKTI